MIGRLYSGRGCAKNAPGPRTSLVPVFLFLFLYFLVFILIFFVLIKVIIFVVVLIFKLEFDRIDACHCK